MMKKLSLAIGAAALLALGALSAPAQAQPHHGYNGHPGYRPHVIVVPPPPPRHAIRHGHSRHYDRHYHHPRYDRHHRGWRDNDRDGVPNRYDRRPNNPYRR